MSSLDDPGPREPTTIKKKGETFFTDGVEGVTKGAQESVQVGNPWWCRGETEGSKRNELDDDRHGRFRRSVTGRLPQGRTDGSVPLDRHRPGEGEVD